MADLLQSVVKLRDVFGSKDFMGQFLKECYFPTHGGPKVVRNKQVPLAKRKLIDSETATMVGNGVIEECPDS